MATPPSIVVVDTRNTLSTDGRILRYIAHVSEQSQWGLQIRHMSFKNLIRLHRVASRQLTPRFISEVLESLDAVFLSARQSPPAVVLIHHLDSIFPTYDEQDKLQQSLHEVLAVGVRDSIERQTLLTKGGHFPVYLNNAPTPLQLVVTCGGSSSRLPATLRDLFQSKSVLNVKHDGLTAAERYEMILTHTMQQLVELYGAPASNFPSVLPSLETNEDKSVFLTSLGMEETNEANIKALTTRVIMKVQSERGNSLNHDDVCVALRDRSLWRKMAAEIRETSQTEKKIENRERMIWKCENKENEHILSWCPFVGGLFEVKKNMEMQILTPLEFPEFLAGDDGASLSKDYSKLPTIPALLLVGPPGCGKSLMAKSLVEAFEPALPIVCVKGPELLSKYIGQSEHAVRQVFERALSLRWTTAAGQQSESRGPGMRRTLGLSGAAAIIFDDLDALVPRRGACSGVMDRIVNQMLCCLDGTDDRGGLIIIGTSSRPDVIDPAVLRPGRFEVHLFCGLPSSCSLNDVICVVGRQFPLENTIRDCRILSDLIQQNLHGKVLTPADIYGIFASATLRSLRKKQAASKDAFDDLRALLLPVHKNVEKDDSSTEPAVTITDIVNSLKEHKPSLTASDLDMFMASAASVMEVPGYTRLQAGIRQTQM